MRPQKQLRRAFGCGAFLLGLGAPPVRAGECIDYRDFIHWAGTAPALANVVAMHGDFLCAAGEPGAFTILNVSAAPSTFVVGSTPIPRFPEGMVVSGEFAYAVGGAAPGDTLTVISIADPEAPTIVGTFAGAGRLTSIDVRGDLAVAVGSDLVVVDVSDPANPSQLGFLDMSSNNQDVAISGNHAFVTGAGSAQIVDLTQPEVPEIVGGISGFWGSCDLWGSLLVLGEIGSTVALFDVSVPSSPQPVGELDAGLQVSGVEAEGDLLCVMDLPGGVLTVDIRSPSNPIPVGRVPLPHRPESLVIHGAHVFVADRGLIEIVDIANPYSAEPTGAVFLSEPTEAIAGVGSYAFLALGAGGLVVMDCHDPKSPAAVGMLPARDQVEDVAVHGTLACLMDDGLRVVDVSDPSAPFERAYAPVSDVHAVALQEDIAAVAVGTSGVAFYDVSIPDSLSWQGSVDIPGLTTDVALAGPRAFVTGLLAGLQVVNFENPAVPFIEGSIALAIIATDVALREEWAYVLTNNGMAIVNVADPAHPVLVNQMLLIQEAQDIVIRGANAYVLVTAGVHVLDLEDPTNPRIVGSISSPRYGAGALGISESGVCVSYPDEFSLYPFPCGGTTPVIVSGFDGRAIGRAVELTWSTSFEDMHDGFHVHRSKSLHAGWGRITADLVRGESPYRFLDANVEPATTYFYRLGAVDWSGEETITPPIAVRTLPWAEASVTFQGVAPNPFSRYTVIRLTLRDAADLRLSIYDVAGRLVRNVAIGRYESGAHRVEWNGWDERGRAAVPGTYFVRLESAGKTLTKKVVLTR